MLDFLHLVVSPPDSSLLYEGIYDPVLVSLSVIVAIFAAYASLLVSNHVAITKSAAARRIWVTVGGLCLGFGIWAMHFVGMLAFNLPCSTSYDASITALSIIPGVLASVLALHTISRRELSFTQLATGGMLIGAGVGAMHYSGMAAMRLSGVIRYDAKLFLLSILVAVVLATAALWIKFRLQAIHARGTSWVTFGSAGVLGLAVSGMHYTAMLAAYFVRNDSPAVSGIAPAFLAFIVLTVTGLIVVVTIVATYVELPNLLSLKRSYRLIGVLVLGWIAIAWVSADKYYSGRSDEAYQQETRLGVAQVENLADIIEHSLQVTRGVPAVVVRQEDTLRLLRRFGPKISPSPLPYQVRKASWTQDKGFVEVNESLALTAKNLSVDAIWLLNAAGDCVSASNSRQPDSFVGTNYSDRDYFIQARAGQHGHQYAVGRTSRLPGLYYSAPVLEGGIFVGAVVVKRNVSNFSAWIDLARAFVADANGVIVIAGQKDWEFHTVPNATAVQMPADRRLSQYQQSSFYPLEISPWGDPRFPEAVRIGQDQLPRVLAIRALPESNISIYLPRPLDALVRLNSERYWLFFLLASSGGLLIIAVSAIVIHLRESQSSEAELRLAATAFESQEGMVITDPECVILRINKSFTSITGYGAEEVIGQPIRILQSGRHSQAFYGSMWERLKRTGGWQGEVWNRRKDGEVYPEWLTISAVKRETGEVTHYVGTMLDITQRKAAEDEINQLAFFDALTQLPNRRLLMDRLQHALAASIRSGRQGALLFLDLDNFKDLNDTLGHTNGDLLLKQVAERFVGCVREGDTVARLGGDEFVVMLEDLSESDEEAATLAEVVAEKILAAINRPYSLSGRQHHSTSSIGITLFSDRECSVDELLKQADLAMYQAKAAGRNTLRFFNPEMQSVVAARAALEADMRLGLQRHEFLLHYQPQINSEGRMTGAEVLVRWQHPERGLVSPAEFIPAAEDSGLILPLGHWVLETACAQLEAWSGRDGLSSLTLSVNVSARQFRHVDFVDQVMAVLDHTGADPKRLKLELTESLLLDDVEGIIAKMTALKALGVDFSLDDFGTGYSSLSYLKRLPLGQLKIDQSFVRDVLTDANDAAIARTIVALGKSLGLSVIAEGVETEAQREFLASQGCNAYQGYLFSRPLPLDQFEHYQRGS